jgi:probable HAF family extracellular repeat protein
MTGLGTLGGSMSRALDINDRGQVAGSSTTTGEQYEEHAFVWADGVMTDLRVRGSIPGASDAVAINERSQIAGRAGGNGFLWENGSATYFGSWPSNPITRIDDLNDAGEVVGYLMSGIESDAFVWSRGVLTPLKTFAASPLCPLRIDNAGAIVAIDWEGAFILRDGVRARLAAPTADSFSCARALNERGGVVGSVRIDFGRQRAALWETGE